MQQIVTSRNSSKYTHMNNLVYLDKARHRDALDCWVTECKKRMGLRFPKIDFNADCWPVKTLYQTKQPDWNFVSTIADFSAKDRSFCDVVRCIVAETTISGKPVDVAKTISAFRRLASTSATSIFDLTVSNLRALEVDSLENCKKHPGSAGNHLAGLKSIATQLHRLGNKKVISPLGYYVPADVAARLKVLAKSYRAERRAKSGDLLDYKMEALNDAVNAMLDNDPRLNPIDCIALCTAIRELCAPSRINEVLCSSIDDYVTVDDYGQKDMGSQNLTHRAHQLLVTMKGSKGAQWSAKPVLNFMIDAFHYVGEIIKKYGVRSRMLVEWYETHPQKLYLPPELESLRGCALSRRNLAEIMYLTPKGGAIKYNYAGQIFEALIDRRFKAPNPARLNVDGRKNSRSLIDFLSWADAEEYLLKQVHLAMAACRKVTTLNHYEGTLSKMLFLFDRDELPFLPYALNYLAISKRLKRTEKAKQAGGQVPSLFEKLGIMMPVNGEIQTAWVDTHDPRRWLTTMALRNGEKLSEVLINKWANRSSIAQLKAYDFRTAEELSKFSRMPNIPELKDLSGGLEQARKLEDTYGLESDIVVVHDAGISLTSLDRVLKAVEDRPIAKTSEQIIIVYPSRYGVCLHQHHEAPCRRYDVCITCNENCCVKGHQLTNDAIREEETRATTSVLRQLEKLVPTLNRGVADNPDLFMEHLELLLGRGLCPKQMADHLIAEFHEIKDEIKDKLLRKRLEEAFVTRGYKRMLDDDSVADGALMKYHNPTQHAAPGLEMALDTHGGREKVARDEQALITKFPVFAPTALGLRDERHLIKGDDDDEED
jgi:hypothetical protein